MKHILRLCLVLTVLALFGLLPTSAAPVTVAVIGLDAPRNGVPLDFTATAAMTGLYAVDEVCWYRASGKQGEMVDTACQPGEPATAGRYLCRVYLTLAPGFTPTTGRTGRIGDMPALLGQFRGRYFLEADFSTDASSHIDTVTLGGIAVPTAGATVAAHSRVAVTRPADCVVTAVEWSIAGVPLGEQVTFRAGDRLSLSVTVAAGSDSRFADAPTAILCGKLPTAAVEVSTGRVYRFIFLFTVGGTIGGEIEATTIGSVDLAADQPRVGDRIRDFNLLPSIGVEVGKITVSPYDTTFRAGRRYTVTVTLEALDGYAFSRAPRPVVTLAGQTAAVTAATASTLTVEATLTAYGFPFTDVASGAWYRTWVEGAHRLGLINGRTATTFAPDEHMTVAEAVKLAACLHQLRQTGQITLENGTPWFLSYFNYCLSAGILDRDRSLDLLGRIDQPITRAEYVVLFARTMPSEALAPLRSVPDGSIPNVPADGSETARAVYRFYRAGILNGRDAAGTFSPHDTISRGEVSAILVRLMQSETRVK